jgi:hypothetical protein
VQNTSPDGASNGRRVQSVPSWPRASCTTTDAKTVAYRRRAPHEPIRGDETGLYPAHTAAELHRPTQVHSKVSVVLWTPCSGVEWRVFEPTIRVRRSGTTRKQPANLAVEGAEESLSILSDDTPPVRPPLKRCLTILIETC